MNPYLIAILAILIARYSLDLVSDVLNIRHVSPGLPEEFLGYHDAERYERSQRYLRENTRFGIVVDTIETPFAIAFILLGGFDYADRVARDIASGPILSGLVFAGMLSLGAKTLGLPFSVYETFVIEERYGFNRTTPKTFVLDMVKSAVLTAAIGGPVFAAVLWFFEKTGGAAWLYCWLAMTLFQILFMFIAPAVIMPLFNRFEPLEEGELRRAIEAYAKAQAFTMKGVFKMDGSKRSAKANAFFTGLGRLRRIVLFDTLIEGHSVAELVSIVAHEMGHYKKRHILKGTARGVILTGLTLFLLSLFIKNEQLFAAFGMGHVSVYASIVFFGFLYTPIAMVTGLIENAISRRHEYEADAFAVRTYGAPEAMISGLKRLAVDNLSNLTPHPLKVMLAYSHPPVLERIKVIRGLTLGPAKAFDSKPRPERRPKVAT